MTTSYQRKSLAPNPKNEIGKTVVKRIYQGCSKIKDEEMEHQQLGISFVRDGTIIYESKFSAELEEGKKTSR